MKRIVGLFIILLALDANVQLSRAQDVGPSAEQIVRALIPSATSPPLTRSWDLYRGVKVEGGNSINDRPSINLYINFAYNSEKLLTDSVITLDNLTTALNDRRLDKSFFLIGGHADAKGSDRYNLKLSERRALTVKQYLINHGVSSKRLIDKGYGESELLDSTRPEDGINRRVEVINLSAGNEN